MEDDQDNKLSFEITKVNKYIVPLLTIAFFILAIYFISAQSEKIGYYNACKDMNLSMVYLDGTRICGDLDKINAENQALRNEMYSNQASELQRQTDELIARLGNLTEVK